MRWLIVIACAAAVGCAAKRAEFPEPPLGRWAVDDVPPRVDEAPPTGSAERTLEECIAILLDQQAWADEIRLAAWNLRHMGDKALAAVPASLVAYQSSNKEIEEEMRGLAKIFMPMLSMQGKVEFDDIERKYTSHAYAKVMKGWDEALPRLIAAMQSNDFRVQRLAAAIFANWFERPEEFGVERLTRADLDSRTRVLFAKAIADMVYPSDLLWRRMNVVAKLAGDCPEMTPVLDEWVAAMDAQKCHFTAVLTARQSPSGKYMEKCAPAIVRCARFYLVDSEHVARLVRGLGPAARRRLAKEIASTGTGPVDGIRLLPLLGEDARGAIDPVAGLLAHADGEVRRLAARVIADCGLETPAVAKAWNEALDDPDGLVRLMAEKAIGTREARLRARVPGLLRELRSDDYQRRCESALRLKELGYEDAEIVGALIRAMVARSMPAREGLTRALESAWKNQKPAKELLQDAARGNGEEAAFARAGLREVARR